MRWVCGIPGKPGTDWEGGVYPLTLEFSDDYPAKPPKVRKKDGKMGAGEHRCGQECTQRRCVSEAVVF